ncbi:hypothetical protein [Cellulomonas palmilytica]|uniref:hypothetical protein n=1 Tax=Cellulomonas palmilytica TaxID=2608402 RepID=UPI001F3BD07A|nr:hypothetical protein [Cellulomonas palmilytica]UJP41426.1 hypothetical protein F1D97_08440 [Cellulomonas palmilytica]
MTFFLVLLVALAVWTAIRLAFLLRRDGLGSRRPPASRASWSDAAHGLPSHPF